MAKFEIEADGGGYVYPHLDAVRDVGMFRVGGAGIGNSLITYFHAMIHAERTGATLIQPAWPSLKLGPVLRGERSKRFYTGLFRPAREELSGVGKLAALALFLKGGWHDTPIQQPAVARTNGKLTVVSCRNYLFEPLKPWREAIRRRFLEIARPTLPLERGWGRGGYIAIHVRLGDFASTTLDRVRSGMTDNLRVPLDWYVAVARRLCAAFPELPVHVLSDGTEAELKPILALENVRIRREGNDLADLAALAGAQCLVGSQSTYSRWGAFLGNMPSIWLETERVGERYSTEDVPFMRVGEDMSAITRQALESR